MKIEKRNELMLKIFNEALRIADAKGKDYSGEEDSLANLRVFGFKGIIIRLFDKLYRLKNIEESGSIAVKNESVRDTLIDAIVYSALAIILLGEHGLFDPLSGSGSPVLHDNDWQEFDNPGFTGKIKVVETDDEDEEKKEK